MKKTYKLLFFFLCMIYLSGCRPSTPKVAVTNYPVKYLVEQIGGEYVEVTSISDSQIIQRAQIKEDYKQILDASDVLFYISGLEPYMEVYLENIRASRTDMIDLSAVSAINQFKRYSSTNLDGKVATVETNWYEGDSFKHIDMYDKDPMLWIDPISMSSMGSTICDYLSTKFPEYAKAFRQNFNRLENELARLDADYQLLRNEHKNVAFVSISPSFGNWQKSYGIKVYPVVLSKYGALPTKEQLQQIKERIKADKIRYIVKEPNLSEDMLQLHNQLSEELGLISVEISNISSLSEKQEQLGMDYKTIMYQNLKVLEDIAE